MYFFKLGPIHFLLKFSKQTRKISQGSQFNANTAGYVVKKVKIPLLTLFGKVYYVLLRKVFTYPAVFALNFFLRWSLIS